MKKLVITDWSTLSMTDDLSTAALQELADVTAYPLTAPEEVAARIGDAELLLCNKTPSPQRFWMPAQTWNISA